MKNILIDIILKIFVPAPEPSVKFALFIAFEYIYRTGF